MQADFEGEWWTRVGSEGFSEVVDVVGGKRWKWKDMSS